MTEKDREHEDSDEIEPSAQRAAESGAETETDSGPQEPRPEPGEEAATLAYEEDALTVDRLHNDELGDDELGEPISDPPPSWETLAADCLEAFPEIEHAEIMEVDGRLLALIVTPDRLKGLSQAELGARLVAYFVGRSIEAYPAIYRRREFKELESCGKDRWRELLCKRTTSMVEYHRHKGPYPKSWRKVMLRSVRAYQSFVEQIRREAPYPPHLQVALTAVVMRDALDLLFASIGRRFEPNAVAFSVYDERFSKTGIMPREYLSLYFQIVGLAAQARHANDLGAGEVENRFEWDELALRARDFFKAMERYALHSFSTPKERRARVLLRILIPIVSLTAIVGVGAAMYRMLKPMEPVANPKKVITKRGGLAVTYFKGTDFKRKVSQSIDARISLHSTGKPHAKADADNFSVRWQGYVRFLKEDRHVLCLEGDGGARLYLGDRLIVDRWKKGKIKKTCGNARVKLGWYPLRVDYFDDKGLASLRFKVGLTKTRAKLVRPVDFCCKNK